MNLLDHPLINGVLFYPRQLTPADVPEDSAGRVLRIPVGKDFLGAYWHCPRPDAPTVLFFHGNGEVMSDYLFDFHREVERLGLNFLVVDYRGYGLSTGSPTLGRLLEDANAAWTHVTGPLGLDPGQVIVMGRSLGSLAALEIAAGLGQRARALVIESGIAAFDNWINRMAALLEATGLDVAGLKSALRSAFNHEEKIRAFPSPVLILHSPHDEIVPVANARQLAAWSDPSRTTLHVFPRGGHNDLLFLNREEYFQVLGRFLAGV